MKPDKQNHHAGSRFQIRSAALLAVRFDHEHARAILVDGLACLLNSKLHASSEKTITQIIPMPYSPGRDGGSAVSIRFRAPLCCNAPMIYALQQF